VGGKIVQRLFIVKKNEPTGIHIRCSNDKDLTIEYVERLIGKSDLMQEVYDLILKLAANDAPVIISLAFQLPFNQYHDRNSGNIL